MKTLRFLRPFLACGLIAAALSSTPAFAISKEDLTALRARADDGNGIAQYNLGLLYATSGEPIADPIEAYVWFNLAADNGATGRALVLLSSQLTKEQISEAKQRLETRRAQLEAKKRAAPVAFNPVSAVEAAPPSTDASNPIVAAPALPDPPISAAPVSDREFSALQAEVKKMSGELSNAWKENEQLKAMIAKGGQASAATDQLQHERDQLRATLASTNEELAKLRAAAGNFENERNALQQKIITAGQAQKDNLGAELTATASKLHAVESQLAQASAAAGELANAKQTLASRDEQLQKVTAENQRLTNLAAQASSAAEAKAAADKEVAALRNALSTVQSQLAATKTAAEANSATRKQLEDTQTKLELALHSVDVQEKEIERLQKELATIDGEREGLAKQLALQKTTLAKPDTVAEERIIQLNAKLETARAAGRQVAQLQKLFSDSQTKLKSAEEDLARANQEKDQLGAQLAAAKTAAPPSGEITRLKTELSDARARLLAASEETLARAKEDREHTIQAATTATASQQLVAQLTSELQQLRQKFTASDSALANANQEREALRQQLASASAGAASQTSTVQARLKAAEDALAAANAERVALVDRVSIAENKANAAANAPAAVAPPPGEDPVELRKELVEMQSKLNSALRTYQLQQDDVDRLQKSLVNIDAERAQLADRVHASDTQASQAQAQAAANQDAASQLAAAREQFRQAQNQIASLAGENAQLKNRLSASVSPSPTASPAAVTPGASSRPASSPAPVQTVATPSRSTPVPPTRPLPPPPPRIHTVADGDTLRKIAHHYYGTSDRWPQILEANRNVIKDVNNLTLGTTLKIP